MNKFRFIILFLIIFSKPLIALELGRLEVASSLNEPFRGILTLDSINPGKLSGTRFSVADQDYYHSLGLTRPPSLKAAQFKIVSSGGRSHAIHISTRQKINSPILFLLIQVKQKQNNYVKQYTILLEPLNSKSPIAGNKKAALKTHQPILKVEPATTHFKGEDNKTLIARNQSLSIIAQNSELHETYSVYQIMRALYLINSHAFDKGNINKLLNGSMLEVPDDTLIKQLNRNQSIKFVYSVSIDYPGSDVGQTDYPPPLENQEEITIQSSVGQQEPVTEGSEGENNQPLESPDAEPSRLNSDRFFSFSRALEPLENPIQSILDDIVFQQEKMDRLEKRLDILKSQPRPGPVPKSESQLNARHLIAIKTRKIDEQNTTIELLRNQLASKDKIIEQLSAQLKAINMAELKKPGQVQNLPTQQADILLKRVPDKLVEQPQSWPLLIKTSLPYLIISLAVIFAIILIMFIRKQGSRKESDLQSGGEIPATEKKRSTYHPSFEDTGEIELKDIQATGKDENPLRSSTTGQEQYNPTKLSLEDLKIEIDVYMAYEQYEEATNLIHQGREGGGNNAWFDLKELEILAATKNLEAFMIEFDRKKSLYGKTLPEEWKDIEKIRDNLCEKLNILAIR